jgi:hypothetical protein
MAEADPSDKECGSPSETDARLTGLAQFSRTFREVLPVESWHPPFCGEIDMRIARDGTWFYQGSRIERPALVTLFSRLLRKDGERYVLVTPVECLGIQVDDVPFIAADLEVSGGVLGQTLAFRINIGDEIVAGKDHPLRFEAGEADGLVPYLHVRGGLWARLTRSLTIDLIGYGSAQEIDGKRMFGVASAGVFFPIAAASEVE